MSTPWAPSIDASSSGELIAISAALSARPSPRAAPMPISAVPAPDMMPLTSAKSTLIRPGVVIRSVMPCTPLSSTSSALRNASISETAASPICSRRSFGITMSVSQLSRSAADAGLGLVAAALALERERPGHHADGERTELAGDGRDDGRASGAGATALARGDEHHVGAAQQLLDVVLGVLGGLAAHLGVGAGAESAGGVTPDVELDVGIAHQQRLGVGVDGDELHALETLFDHPVDGIDAAATDADHLDDGEIVVRGRHGSNSSLLLRGAGPLAKTLNLNHRLRVMSSSSVQTER